ncbi:hypothetical protein BCR44DRAFT_35152 [Catenaria anguillulae PL171]|uniref:Uncharacterized protein n=1 Tax=Catenaria anguillulae PL171 TaxID=765915 RepID=A0A1Y2H9L1_9FUNG|nr:hypothetical protein BCR44DRAFT_35152 [Catenaria anguillulae PL171]
MNSRLCDHMMISTTDTDDSPSLPFVLAESILITAAHITLWTDPRWFICDQVRHAELGTFLTVLPTAEASKTLVKIAVPGMFNGCAKLSGHGIDPRYLYSILNKHNLELLDDDDEQTYIDAFINNAVPVLEWLCSQPDFEPPDLREFHYDDNPVILALENKALDALEWACKRRRTASYGLMDNHLADMLRSESAREVALAVAWLKAGHHVEPYLDEVVTAACEVGLLEVVQLYSKWISERGGIDPEHARDLCELAEASGHQEVVTWCQANGWCHD